MARKGSDRRLSETCGKDGLNFRVNTRRTKGQEDVYNKTDLEPTNLLGLADVVLPHPVIQSAKRSLTQLVPPTPGTEMTQAGKVGTARKVAAGSGHIGILAYWHIGLLAYLHWAAVMLWSNQTIISSQAYRETAQQQDIKPPFSVSLLHRAQLSPLLVPANISQDRGTLRAW